MNQIPIMDDPLGKHWEQPPDIRTAPMDETHVCLTPHQIQDLHEYSATYPTGVYPGKCWRRIERHSKTGKQIRHLLVWYGPENNRHNCPIEFRNILIV